MNCRLLLVNFGLPALCRGYATKAVQSSAGKNIIIFCNILYILKGEYDVFTMIKISGMMGLGKGKKPGVGIGGPATVKPVLPVESDVQKLVDYCCGSNIKTTGEDVKVNEVS